MIQVGQTIGNYTIAAKLGEGGMGVVYLAEHPVIGRKVAMKAIHPELARNPEVISRFMNEAKSVNQIGNEHIVDVMDYGKTPDGEFYFIMEYLQGEALADRLRRDNTIEPGKAFQMACQVADALAASHAHGIIHRDLKPENIYLIQRGGSPDFVKVLDFGLAKLTQGDEKVTHKTRTGSVMGTPYYMAPEQCEGKANIDHRADVYSLGVIVFEMLTGRVPFGGEGYGEIIVKHITMPPPSPRSFNASLTMAHEAVVLRALEKNRETRFQSMDEFRAAMVDPVGYLAGAPRSSAAVAAAQVPTSRVDDDVSGAVVFGGERRTSMATAVSGQRASQPSTFRDGAGEMVSDTLPKRSNKGLVVGAVAAAAIAGVAAFFTLQNKPAPPTAPVAAAPGPTAPRPAVVKPIVPAAPKTVQLAFSSTPEGAVVTRKDTGKELGKTPFDVAIESGTAEVAFVFAKVGFGTEEKVLAPVSNGRLDATLVAVEKPEEQAGGRKPSKGSSSRAKKPVGTNVTSPAKPTKKPGRPIDEDGVLEPSFK